jgi:hypothetical protein
MKHSIILLLFSLALVTSCNIDNYENLNNSYTGIHPATEYMDEGGNMISEPAFEMKVRIDNGKIYIDNENPDYLIEEENDEQIILKASFNHSGEESEMRFKFLKASNELILMDEDPSKNILFLTEDAALERKLNSFALVPLTTDISHLSENQKEMLSILFEVADIMEEIFWMQAYGDKNSLFETTESEVLKGLYKINYGPWERLNNNKPFLSQYDEKPKGANFYPADMTDEEFQNFDDKNKSSLYTLIRRDENGGLKSVWYREAYYEQVQKASDLLKKAAQLAEDEGFKNYLNLRAEALLTDEYYESDAAWMQMKTNKIDFVVGPIENYEDQLYNYKAAHESFILIKDLEWSNKLSRLVDLLPMLQKELPVAPKFKKETPGSGSELNVYDAVYYAGDCNAGSKTIAINLPNDPKVRANFGSRKLQLKNSIRFKFEKILIPISNVLIAEDQRQYIDFNAFFENTMFHEVAHGLGLDYTINNKGTVREALKDTYSAIEEGKADILGLYIVSKLADMGELGEKDLMTNYVTFMASTFRSVRFGVASAHGKANMIRFYYFQEQGAFTRDEDSGTYRIDFEKMKSAMESLTREIISMQGLGDYEKASQVIAEKAFIREQLKSDLNRLGELSIPVDIVFEQGPQMLGLAE